MPGNAITNAYWYYLCNALILTLIVYNEELLNRHSLVRKVDIWSQFSIVMAEAACVSFPCSPIVTLQGSFCGLVTIVNCAIVMEYTLIMQLHDCILGAAWLISSGPSGMEMEGCGVK